MKKNLRSVELTETHITQGVVKWACLVTMPRTALKIRDFLIGIPNAGKRRVKVGKDGKKFCVEGKRLVAEGMRKGASDLFLAYPSGGKHGLWMEGKAPKKNLRIEQAQFLHLMEMCDYETATYRSIDEGIKIIKDYLGMR